MSIQVQLLKSGEHHTEQIENGVHAVPSDDGNWLYIYDDDGLTVAVFPKDAVISVRVRGETMMTSDNPGTGS